ncbi:DUF327 family protein [Oceanobacillus piezotolerans]|uniref:DUF327 family protein n=1 Tax=Oceanobacillus piezotolerans TaxID=2448030 RepID=A0A498D2F7_9BACI|nr:YaaR family protein [Oceanobacillus piezotolerans]RLL41703.1 DUF327 family protein [Oceanobacillus piezotolerans]
MKITNDIQTQAEKKYVRQPSVDARSFSNSLQAQTIQLKQQEFEKLIKNITVQGNILARSRNFRDLARFKRMIKDFLQEAVTNGYKLHKEHQFGFNGSRKLTIVKEIDEKLLQLTEEIMNQEEKTVHILGLIGEIKGLLINLYT